MSQQQLYTEPAVVDCLQTFAGLADKGLHEGLPSAQPGVVKELQSLKRTDDVCAVAEPEQPGAMQSIYNASFHGADSATRHAAAAAGAAASTQSNPHIEGLGQTQSAATQEVWAAHSRLLAPSLSTTASNIFDTAVQLVTTQAAGTSIPSLATIFSIASQLAAILQPTLADDGRPVGSIRPASLHAAEEPLPAGGNHASSFLPYLSRLVLSGHLCNNERLHLNNQAKLMCEATANSYDLRNFQVSVQTNAQSTPNQKQHVPARVERLGADSMGVNPLAACTSSSSDAGSHQESLEAPSQSTTSTHIVPSWSIDGTTALAGQSLQGTLSGDAERQKYSAEPMAPSHSQLQQLTPMELLTSRQQVLQPQQLSWLWDFLQQQQQHDGKAIRPSSCTLLHPPFALPASSLQISLPPFECSAVPGSSQPPISPTSKDNCSPILGEGSALPSSPLAAAEGDVPGSERGGIWTAERCRMLWDYVQTKAGQRSDYQEMARLLGLVGPGEVLSSKSHLYKLMASQFTKYTYMQRQGVNPFVKKRTIWQHQLPYPLRQRVQEALEKLEEGTWVEVCEEIALDQAYTANLNWMPDPRMKSMPMWRTSVSKLLRNHTQYPEFLETGRMVGRHRVFKFDPDLLPQRSNRKRQKKVDMPNMPGSGLPPPSDAPVHGLPMAAMSPSRDLDHASAQDTPYVMGAVAERRAAVGGASDSWAALMPSMAVTTTTGAEMDTSARCLDCTARAGGGEGDAGGVVDGVSEGCGSPAVNGMQSRMQSEMGPVGSSGNLVKSTEPASLMSIKHDAGMEAASGHGLAHNVPGNNLRLGILGSVHVGMGEDVASLVMTGPMDYVMSHGMASSMPGTTRVVDGDVPLLPLPASKISRLTETPLSHNTLVMPGMDAGSMRVRLSSELGGGVDHAFGAALTNDLNSSIGAGLGIEGEGLGTGLDHGEVGHHAVGALSGI